MGFSGRRPEPRSGERKPSGEIGSIAPGGAWVVSPLSPRLAPWATISRRSAAAFTGDRQAGVARLGFEVADGLNGDLAAFRVEPVPTGVVGFTAAQTGSGEHKQAGEQLRVGGFKGHAGADVSYRRQKSKTIARLHLGEEIAEFWTPWRSTHR